MTAAAIFENKNSPYVSNCLTDRREIWHGDAYWQFDSYLPCRQLKIRPFKNPGRRLNNQKSRYVGKGLTDRDNLTVTQPRLTGSAVKITNPNRQPTLTILLQNQNLFGGWASVDCFRFRYLNIATSNNNDIRLPGLH